jgi:small subunit ribosomal protein S21
MLIVKIDKNTPIEKALKQLKNKVIKTRQSQELINRKTFVKKSSNRRNQINKAIYAQKMKNEN